MAEIIINKTNTDSAGLFLWPVTALFILLLNLLPGCTPVAERSLAPMDLPANFSIPGKIPFQSSWWIDFQDDALTQLIADALTDNFSLRLARERIEEARAFARQTGAALLPTVDSQGTISSLRNYQQNSSNESFLLGLAASYEVDLWGRLRNQRDASVFDALATEADYHTAAITLAAETAIIWYRLVESELQLDLLTRQKQTNTKVLDLISVQFRAGQVGIADVLQQRQLVESNIGALAGLRAEIQVLRHQLAILTGVPPGAVYMSGSRQLPNLPPLPETGIPLDLLSDRPDIESSFLRLRAADNRVASAIANQLPRLALSADFSTSGDSSGDLFNNWFSTLAANLFGPVFDGGQRRAAVAGTESIARQRFYSHGQIILEAIGEVENSLIREKEQAINLRSLEAQLQYATETIGHVAHRYRQGAEDYQRVLLALLSQQSLQRTILAGKLQLIEYRIALYRALSGRIPVLATAIAASNAHKSSSLLPSSNPSKRQ